MTTFTIIDNSKEAKAFLAYIKTLSFVEVMEENNLNCVAEEKSPYNTEFVAKIKKAEQEIKDGKGIEIDPNDVWGSLGLK